MPPLEELASNVSLILVNSHFSISGVRPVVPNFVEVGGLHIEEPRPLSKVSIVQSRYCDSVYLCCHE